MKRNYTLLLATFCFLALQGFAQTAVTFRVDMNNVAEFDAATDVLRVAGEFQMPAQWDPPAPSGNNILTDPDGDGVYSVTYSGIMLAEFQYKYVINTWAPTGANEFSGDTPGTPGDCLNGDNNRLATINTSQSTAVLPAYLYNSCDISAVVSNRNISELSQLDINPNPVSDFSRITFGQAGVSHNLTLVNAVGAVVMERSDIRTGYYDFERSGLTSGFYLLQVSNSQGERSARRIILR